MTSLSNRVAIITGSARNIGRATAFALAGEGASIMVHARSDREGVEATVADLRAAGAKAHGQLADLSTEAGAATLVQATLDHLGAPTILVNNAAVRRNTPVTELSLAEWREVLGASLDASFLMTRDVTPHMIAAGWGRIVNLGGISMFKGLAGRAHVSAAKAGMIGMSRSLASELGPHGITVNVVAPGSIETVRGAAAGARPAAVESGVPVGRRGAPEEIAHVVRMLCMPDAAYTTGQTIQVNGGAHYS
ncbi:MAG: SDR family NAD(P)-dependent oxidoreductase [Hyphomicrobiaceae bacterium]